jgi:FMN phosphatase YigB (HAD superfamily)
VNHKLFLRPELVVFDLDNTFYEYETAHRFAFSALLDDEQFSSDRELVEAYEKARAFVKNRLRDTASSHSRLLYLSECFSILKVQFNTSEILRLEALYWGKFLSEMVLFPNSVKFVDDLLSQKIECALVTDLTASIQYKKIETLDLVNKFQYVVTSEEAGGDKATALPWKLLDERADLARFSSIWYVGDSIFDLNPTMRRTQDAGFLKIDQGPIVSAGDHHLFSSFEELSSLLK